MSLIVTLGCGLDLDKSQGLEGAQASSNYPPSTMTTLALLVCIGAGSQRLQTLLPSFRDPAKKDELFIPILAASAGPQRIGGFQSGISFYGLFLQLFSRGCSKNEKKRLNFFRWIH